MTQKKLEKKFILTANFAKTEDEKLEKETNIVKAQIDNPTYVPGLNPTAASVELQIVAITDPATGLIAQRDAARALEKNLTGKVNQAINSVQDIITRQWLPQVEAVLKNDPDKLNKAKTLQLGVKTIDTGETPVGASIAKEISLNYFPDISRIDVNVHDQHTIHIKDNLTGKRRLHPGILRVDVYGFTGAQGLAIADLSALIALGGGYLGEAAKGKFVNTFDSSSTGKTEYYVVVYVSKKTKKPVAQSKVVSALIN